MKEPIDPVSGQPDEQGGAVGVMKAGTLAAVVEAALRKSGHWEVPRPADDGTMCRLCGFFWPCQTVGNVREALAAHVVVALRDAEVLR